MRVCRASRLTKASANITRAMIRAGDAPAPALASQGCTEHAEIGGYPRELSEATHKAIAVAAITAYITGHACVA